MKKVKRKYFSMISAPLIVAFVSGGSLLWLNRAAAHNSNALEKASYRLDVPATGDWNGRRSVIKVHSDRGVIVLPGAADNWDQVEDALLVADSLADVQMVNNEVGWTVGSD